MANPFAAFPVTDTWQDHLNRGARGGIDYGMPVGTPLPSPSNGKLTNESNAGDAGNRATVTRADGSKTQYLHLSKFISERDLKVGDIMGYSGGARGADGAGNSTGAHLHAHDYSADGTRVPPFSTISAADGVSSGGSTASGNPLQNAQRLFQLIYSTSTWVRIGLGLLGAFLIYEAVVATILRSDTGQSVVKGLETIGGTAINTIPAAGPIAKSAVKVAAQTIKK